MPDKRTFRVYVVDDEEVIAKTLAKILELSGFTAVAFTNPLDALSQSETAPPDLLLSDVMMPQLSGIQLAIRVQELCPKCKILLFSGQAATADLLQKARADGHDFHLLSKPVHPADLLAAIRTLG
jgi:CheY-like chemotaxis protein